MKLSENVSIKIFLGLLLSVILFHFSIMSKIVPYDIAWGGRLKNDNEMYVFETISIAINLFLIWILLMKGGFVKFKFSNSTLKVVLWLFFVVFLLNTIGNLFAKTNFEKFFAFLTSLSAFLIWNILHFRKTTD